MEKPHPSVASPTSSSRTVSVPVSGMIRSDELYTIEEFKRRLGLKDAAIRSARSKKFRVIHEHGRAFVLGQDWIDYLLASKREQP